jgi:hypothetical protein
MNIIDTCCIKAMLDLVTSGMAICRLLVNHVNVTRTNPLSKFYSSPGIVDTGFMY